MAGGDSVGKGENSHWRNRQFFFSIFPFCVTMTMIVQVYCANTLSCLGELSQTGLRQGLRLLQHS